MPWSPEAESQRNNVTTNLIWAKLSKVPKELWTKKGLSFLASLIGGPLCMDGATSMKRRLDFAKVCVTIPLDFEFPSSIKLKIHGKVVFIDMEYPWKPPSCSRCTPAAGQNSQNVATPSFSDPAGSDVLSMINVAVDNRESPSSARTSKTPSHDL
ncbi:hypothetical protein IFM89_008358 [Coptis chinensis]|uniref:DUF4283 domain-containing protein n=1 Tax=Coptis chinensis TaxID=261450 RepID=A0A835M7G6_9MAGN|nr:hypothetical protein IFM89_008358 [Coptis chinensis]